MDFDRQAKFISPNGGYSKTDPDASAMTRKEDRAVAKPLPRPAYNVQVGVAGQMIVGFSVHQSAGDAG